MVQYSFVELSNLLFHFFMKLSLSNLFLKHCRPHAFVSSLSPLSSAGRPLDTVLSQLLDIYFASKQSIHLCYMLFAVVGIFGSCHVLLSVAIFRSCDVY